MKIFFRSLLAVLSLSAPLVVLSQQPEAVLRFDAVQREELTDEAALFSVADTTILFVRTAPAESVPACTAPARLISSRTAVSSVSPFSSLGHPL